MTARKTRDRERVCGRQHLTALLQLIYRSRRFSLTSEQGDACLCLLLSEQMRGCSHLLGLSDTNADCLLQKSHNQIYICAVCTVCDACLTKVSFVLSHAADLLLGGSLAPSEDKRCSSD